MELDMFRSEGRGVVAEEWEAALERSAPQLTQPQLRHALVTLLQDRHSRGALTPDQAVFGRRLLKSVRRWDTRSPARRKMIWVRLGRIARRERLTPASTEALARQAPSKTDGLSMPESTRELHELSETQLEDLALRQRVIAMHMAGSSVGEIVKHFSGTRSRAWVYRVIANHDVRGGDLSDQRTRERERPTKYGEIHRAGVEDLYYRESSRATVRDVAKALADLCVKNGLPVPSETWVRDHIDGEPQLKLFRDLGSKEFRRQARATTVRDGHVVAGAIYEMDSTAVDIWTRVEKGDGTWKAVRQCATVVMDVGSRAIVGFHLSIGKGTGAPTEEAVKSAWLHAITPSRELPAFYGLPKELRIDNGSEYTLEFRNTVQASGTTVTVGIPYYSDARGKIESVAGFVGQWCREVPGCTDVFGGSQERAQKAIKQLWTPEELHTWFARRVRRRNDTERHPSSGKAPTIVWEQNATPTLVSDSAVLALLPHVGELKVMHGVLTVEVAYRRYPFHVPADLSLNFRRVEVRWSDLEDALHMFDRKTKRYLGRANAIFGVFSQEDVDAMLEERALAAQRTREVEMPGRPQKTAEADVEEQPSDQPPAPAESTRFLVVGKIPDALREPVVPIPAPVPLDDEALRLAAYLLQVEA